MVFNARRLILVAASFAALASASPVERDAEPTVFRVPIVKKANNKLNSKIILEKDAARLSSFATGSVPATNADITYSTVVTAGSQNFNLIVDTGSSNTWVGAGTAYKPSVSAQSTGDSFSVTYGSGSVTGTEYFDKVTVGSLSIAKQSIGVATASSAQGFEGFDGIIGFGPVDLTEGTVGNTATVPTVLDNAKSAGTISTEVLGVHFHPESGSDTDDQNGELTFGGVDSTLYTGSITYTPKSTTSPYSYYWGVTVTSLSYGSTTLASGDSAIVDTGTTLIYVPILAYANFLSLAGGSTDSASGLAAFNSKPTGTVTFVIGGASFTLSPTQYLIPTSQYAYYGLSTSKYYSYIGDGGISQADVNFIIGQKFLENYYSVFDTTNSRIGFATAV